MAPQTKGIKDFHELKEFIQTDKQKEYSITSLFKHFCTKQLDALFIRFKTKGISLNEAILKLLLMTIGQMTIFRCVTQEGEHAIAGKDAFYSIKNNPLTDWRVIVMTMVIRFQTLKKHSIPAVGIGNGIRCMIADDTAIPKRGKTMEGISRIWGHVFHRSILGFKGLFLAFWDGVSFIPVDFSLHNEKGKNPDKPFGLSKKVARNNKKRCANTPGDMRKKELELSKITSLINIVSRALKQGLKAEYLLVDSWFMCEELIRFIFKKPGMFILGMCKMGRAKYDLGSKSYDAPHLLNLCK